MEDLVKYVYNIFFIGFKRIDRFGEACHYIQNIRDVCFLFQDVLYCLPLLIIMG